MAGYEGFCMFCRREIGTGHERGCPYHVPRPARRHRPAVDPLEPRALMAIVAVVDSGVDASVFPAGSILPGFDARHYYTGAHDDTSPIGGAHGYHGTSVASVILAHDPNAKILPVVVGDASGNVNMEDVARAISISWRNGARIVNVSLGSTEFDGVLVASLAVADFNGHALVVAAAGDYGVDLRQVPVYPAASNFLTNVVSVGAAGPSGALLPSSDRGLVDYAAPGQAIPVTLPGGGHTTLTGTSFAAAIVSGVASRLADLAPAAGPLGWRRMLHGVFPTPAGSTSTVLGNPGQPAGSPPALRRPMRRIPIRRPPATPVLPSRRISALAFRPPATPVPPGGGRP